MHQSKLSIDSSHAVGNLSFFPSGGTLSPAALGAAEAAPRFLLCSTSLSPLGLPDFSVSCPDSCEILITGSGKSNEWEQLLGKRWG